MVDISRVGDAKDETVESVKNATSKLNLYINGWFRDFNCDECGSTCVATTEFVREQCIPMNIWKCENCGARYYREDD